MKKKALYNQILKSGFCLLVITILCAIFLCACVNSGIEYNVGFSDSFVFGSKDSDNGDVSFGWTGIINNSEELKTLCAEWRNPAFDEKKEGYTSELSQKIRGYDDKYFQNKALIIISSLEYNSKKEPRVHKLITDGNELIIEISLKRGTYIDIAESWLFLIEVNQTSIQDIKNITIKNKTRLKYK